MSAANAALFTPFTINTLELPNRIVMAPMTRNFSPALLLVLNLLRKVCLILH